MKYTYQTYLLGVIVGFVGMAIFILVTDIRITDIKMHQTTTSILLFFLCGHIGWVGHTAYQEHKDKTTKPTKTGGGE